MPEPQDRKLTHYPLDLYEVREKIEELLQTGNINMFKPIPLGIPILDNQMNGGLLGGNLMMVSGVQNVGKTSLLLHIASNIAKSGALAIFVCYEHTEKELYEKLICQNSYDHDISKTITAGLLQKAFIDTIEMKESILEKSNKKGSLVENLVTSMPGGMAAMQKLNLINHNLWLYTADATEIDLAKLKILVEFGLEHNNNVVLIVDYLQKIPTYNLSRDASDEDRFNYLVNGLHSFTLTNIMKGYVTPIIAVSSIDPDGLKNGEVHAEDMEGGSKLKYDPDVIVIMNKDDELDRNQFRTIRISLEKSRRGDSDIEFRVPFYGPGLSFLFENATEVPHNESWQNRRNRNKNE